MFQCGISYFNKIFMWFISSSCYPSALIKQLILTVAVSVQLFIHTPDTDFTHSPQKQTDIKCSLCFAFLWHNDMWKIIVLAVSMDTTQGKVKQYGIYTVHTQTVISVPCYTVGAPWYYIQLRDCKAEGKKEFLEKI